MRRNLFFVVIGILCLFLIGATQIQPKRIVHVGVYENPPKIYTSSDGTVAGFWPEIINSIAQKENWQVIWVHGTWDEDLQNLAANKIDIMPDTGWTQERSQEYAFTSDTILASWSRVYVQNGSSIQNILDLEGKKVAGLSGSVNFDGTDGIKDLTANLGIHCTFVGMNSYLAVFQALQNKEVDVGVINKDFGDLNEGNFSVTRTSIIIQPMNLRFALSKNSPLTPYLLQTIDADVKAMKADPNSIYFKALDEYLGEKPQNTIIKVIPSWVYIVLANVVVIILILSILILVIRRQVRRRTEELLVSEAHNRALLENNPDQIFRLSKEGIFLDFHSSEEGALYASPEQFLGKNIQTVLPINIATVILKKITTALETNTLQFYEYQLAFEEGNRDFEARLAPSDKNEVVVFVRNITAGKQAQRELQESEHRYETLTNIAPVGIFHTDNKGLTTYVNSTWCQISGISSEEALGNGWLNAVHPDDRTLLFENWQKVTDVPTISRSDYRFVHADGTITWVIGQAVPEFNLDNQVVGFVGTITDITERKKVEDLQAAVIKAESADKLKSAFLATMSHELRTPLNSIIGFTGILLQKLVGPLNAEQEKQLKMVQGSANHLLELINDVLDISKIEAGQITIFPEVFDFGAAVQKSIEKVIPMAEKKGLAINVDIFPQKIEVNSDRRRVEQILINLLNNAVKFTEKGEIKVEYKIADGFVITSVTDTGIGIKQEDIQTLFKPFQQVDTGISRQYEGTGLGLSICKRLVELMGGQIFVTSKWGEGSTFSFTLPLEGKVL